MVDVFKMDLNGFHKFDNPFKNLNLSLLMLEE